MLKLCGIAASNYYNKVKLQLIEKAVAFEEELVSPSQDDGVLARTPMGKVPFVEVNGHTLAESQVISEYIEEVYPARPLLPQDPLARAKVRELIEFIELHLELVARRLYGEAFFGGAASDRTKEAVGQELDKGVRAFMRLAKFAPFVAGPEFTLADCAAIAHLPVVTLAAKRIYGRELFADHPQVGAYLKEMSERPAARRVAEDRTAQQKLLAERGGRRPG
ncbi:MAG TPA: glutathione S-transferase [Burkholderiales bacterium]|nr:glutathione S-transferase [Burkholderiales bacterium]